MKFVVSASTFLAASWLLALNKASVVVASLDENAGNNNNNNNMNMNVMKERDLTAGVQQQQGRRKTSFVGSREEGRIPRQEGYGPSGGVEGPMRFKESSSMYYGSEPQDQDMYFEQGVMYYDPQEEGQRPREGFGPSGSEQGPMEQETTTTGGGLRGYGATTNSAGEEDYYPMMIPGSFEAAAYVPPQTMTCPDSAIMVAATSDNNRLSKSYTIGEEFANGGRSTTSGILTEPYSMELICVKSDSCLSYRFYDFDGKGFADASVFFYYFGKDGKMLTHFKVNKGTIFCGDKMKCGDETMILTKITGEATYQFGNAIIQSADTCA